MFRKVPDNWDTDVYRENAEINSKKIEYTVEDIKFDVKKVLLCGRGIQNHPDFHPRFSTPTTDIESELYVTVDHSPAYERFIKRKGNYAISIITNPKVSAKILEQEGKVYWFSPEYLDYGLPTIFYGKNSGLAEIALSSYFHIQYILLSGISLTDNYSQFLESKQILFQNVKESGSTIFSLDGVLAEKIDFEDWCKI